MARVGRLRFVGGATQSLKLHLDVRCSLHERGSFTLARENGSRVRIIDQRPGHLNDLIAGVQFRIFVHVYLIVAPFELVIRRSRDILNVSLRLQNRLKFASADRCRTMARGSVPLFGTSFVEICHQMLLFVVLKDAMDLLCFLVISKL